MLEDGPARPLHFNLEPARIVFVIAAIGAVLVALGMVAAYLIVEYPSPNRIKVGSVFLLGEDSGIATWYAAAVLAMCAAALAACSMVEPNKRPWRLVAIVFAALSVDEVAMIHERGGMTVKWLVPSVTEIGGFLRYAWVFLGIPFVLVLAVVLWRWFFSLPSQTRTLFALAAVLYVGGALGIEMLNAYIDSQVGALTHAYQMSTVVEETCEMAGTCVFLYALLNHLRRLDVGVSATFASSVATSDAREPKREQPRTLSSAASLA